MFVRTFGCNLTCSWCDTAKTWATTQEKAAKTVSGKLFTVEEQRHLMTPDDVVSTLLGKWNIINKPTNIIISGGEPMMQWAKLIPLMRTLFDWGNRIHIETAGTIKTVPDFDVMVHQYNVSPKLHNSGNDFKKRYKPDALRSLMRTEKARFKFVVRDLDDFSEIDFIVKDLDILPQFVQVMPEGIRPQRNIRIAQEIIDEALKLGFGLSFRSHILIWGAKEGV